MKSKRLLILLLMALLVPWAANAQETVTVYNGTNENSYVPIYGLYFDDGVKCEFVIPADQLEDMANGSISAMKFYLKSVGSTTLSPTFTVFVKEVDFTTLTALTGTTGATIVFNNSITFTQGTSDVEIDIPFSSSYSYGGGNLLIGIYQNQALGSPNYTSTSWYGVNQDYNSAWSGSGSGSGRKFLPKTTFTYTPGATDCDKPTAIAVNNITPEGAVVTWEGDGNAWNLRYKASTDADYTMVNNLTSQTYPLTGLNSNTQYSVGVQTVCTGSTSLFKSTSFTTDNPCLAPTNLQITEITHESAILSWTAGYPTQASWTVKYQTSNSNWNSAQSVTVNSPTVTLENLESNKKYYVRIYACTDGEYVSGSFTTKNPCAAPTNFVVSDLTNNSAVISWTPGYTTQDSWIVKYKKNSVTSWNDAETKTVEAPTTTLDGLDENTKYDVRIYACADGSYLSGNFTTKYACSAPTNFEASNITPTSATLSWTPGYQETEWTVKYCATTATNDTITETVSGTPTLNLSGLTKLTKYNVRIYNCENYLSGSFVTAARIPLNEPFATTSIPLRWTRYKGLLGGVLADTVNLTTVSGYWNFGTKNGVFDNHAYINNYSTDHCYWLVTPALVMENNVQLSFDLALTQYSGTLQPVVDTLQSDDKFVVLIANIGADTTWTVLRQWDNQGSEYVYNNIACSAAGQNVTIDLSNYAGQNIAIAFYAESTNPTGMANTGGDNNLHIDNVSIDYIPDCSKPTGLVATEPYGHGATLSWTSDATKWVVAYKKAAAEDFTEISDITQNPYTIAGLDPETTYDVKVKANCSGTFSEWSNTAHFTTTVACPAPTGLVATLTQGNGTIATLDWIGNASEYLVQYGITGDTLTATASDTTVALTGLTPEKNYFARVKAVCGGIDGESVWSTTITFTPTNTYPFTVNDSTYTNSYVPVYGLYCDSYSRSQFIIPATKLADMQWGEIVRLTFYCNNTSDDWRKNKFNIYVMETSETTLSALVDWDDMELVAEGIELHINSNKTMSIEFSNPYQYLGGNLLIGINQTKKDYYSSSYWYGVEATGASLGGYGTTISQQNFLPKTTFNYIPGEEPSCFKPTGFAVSDETPNGATITWNPIEGATFEYVYGAATLTPDFTNATSTTRNSVVIEDETLTPNTAYIFYLRRVCENNEYSDTVITPFKTACGEEPVPYTYDFETPNKFECWTPFISGIYIANGTTYNHTEGGSKGLFFSGSTDKRVALPLFSEPTNTLRIVFWTRPESYSYSSCGKFDVGYMTDLEDAETFHALATYNYNDWTADAFEKKSVDFNNPDDEVPADAYIVLRQYDCASNYYWYVDDVTVEVVPSCEYPVVTEVTDITPTSATLNWTGEHESFNVQYRTAEYSYPAEGSFFDDFESGTLTGWTTIRGGEGNDYTDWKIFDGNFTDGLEPAHSGTYVAMSRSWATNDYNVDNWLISPQVTLNGSLIYWVRDDGSYHEHYDVYVSTTTNDAASFTLLYEPGNASDIWTKHVVDLSSYNGTLGYIAFRHTDEGQDWLFIDDVTIGPMVTVEAGEWSDPIAVTENNYPLDNLDSGTEYEWQVQGICESSESIWVAGDNFTTLSACVAPVADSAINITYNSADLYWTGYQENFNVRYRVPAFSNEPLFTEDFADGELGDWTTYNLYYNDDYEVGSGVEEGYFEFFTYGATSPQYLVSPELEGLSEGGYLYFDYATYYSYIETFKVGFSSTTNEVDGDAFTWSKTYTLIDEEGESTYGNFSIEIPAGTKYFAIQSTSTGNYSEYFLVSDFMVYGPDGEWQYANNVTSPATIDELEDGTWYEWQVQGAGCADSDWSNSLYFQTEEQTTVTQTIALSAGWNWVSIYLENEDPEAMMLMLQEALDENGLQIVDKYDFTTYADGEWGDEGELEEVSNDKMYMIQTSAACTVELQGRPGNPADYPITIKHGWNWIGFPSAEVMRIEDAFADFEAEDDDMIVGKFGYTTYVDEWGDEGDLEVLTPGEGYMYYYNGDEQELVIQTRAKARRAMTNMHIPGNLVKAVKHVSDPSKTAKVEQLNQFKTKK